MAADADRTARPRGASDPSDRRIVRVVRRTATISIYAVLFVVVTLGAPLLVPLAVVIDLVRGAWRLPGLRIYAMLWVALACELAGVVGATLIWATERDPDRAFDRYVALKTWWAGALFRWGCRIFRVRIDAPGSDLVAPGPVIIFARHVSVADTLLPIWFAEVGHGMHIRYVLRRMFLADPCIDIVGNALPNCFVARASGQTEREVGGVVRLLEGLGANEGVAIFPEGGLASDEVRERLHRRLEAKGEHEALDRARSYRHMLPPRPGGPFALLRENPGADVAFLVHTGLEGATSMRQLWRGALIGRTITVEIERVPFAEVPADPGEQAQWLHEQWLRLDGWVAARLGDGHDTVGAGERTPDAPP